MSLVDVMSDITEVVIFCGEIQYFVFEWQTNMAATKSQKWHPHILNKCLFWKLLCFALHKQFSHI